MSATLGLRSREFALLRMWRGGAGPLLHARASFAVRAPPVAPPRAHRFVARCAIEICYFVGPV